MTVSAIAGRRLVLVLVLALGLWAGTQERGVDAQQVRTPVFRAEVELVAIDVSVVDRDGRPVTGLQATDFQVTIDGKDRRVASAQYVAQRPSTGTPLRPSRVDSEEAVEATYASNESATTPTGVPIRGRSIIIAIDQGSFTPAATRGLIAAASGLLDSLNPLDRVGLMAFPAPGTAIAPSVNHQRVKEALSRLGGLAENPPRLSTGISLAEALSASRGDPGEFGRVVDRVCAGTSFADLGDGRPSQAEACRQQIQADIPQYVEYARRGSTVSLQELSNLMRLLAVVPGPKTVILISAGLIAGEHSSALGTLGEVRTIAELAAVAEASVYVIYAESSFFDANSLERQRTTGFARESDLRQAGLQHIATLTGGPVFRLGASGRTAFARVAQELSGYYLLGVESQPTDRDGLVHPIRVRVSRANASVRAREQVFVPLARGSRTGDEAVLAALKAPGIQKDLPIRLSAQVLRDAAPERVRLVLSATIGRGVQDAAHVRVAYSIRSGAGKSSDSGVESRRLSVVGAGRDAALSFVDTVLLTPSRYTIRFAAADATGRIGTVEHQVTAGLINGDGVMLSDLILVDPSRVPESGMSPLTDGRVSSDRLDAYLEVYPQDGGRVTGVKFDVAERPGGPSLVSFDVPFREVDAGSRWAAQGGVDLADLPPGAYSLVASVHDGTRTVGTVFRPFRYEGPVAALARGGPRLPFSMAAAGELIRRFRPEDALRAEAVGFFISRLADAETQTASPAVAAASAAAKDGRYDEVLVQLAGSVEPTLSASFLRGLALFSQGQLEPAAAQFRNALRSSSEFLPAAFYLGACYAAGGRDREAVGAWQTSLVTESESRIVYDVLADGWLRLNDGVQAESIIREAMGRWPGDHSFVPRLAAALAIRQQRKEALGVLAPYLDRRPDDGEALFLGMRLLYDAAAEGKPVRSGGEDAELGTRYALLYRDAGGAHMALVDRWAAFLRKQGEGRK